LTDVVQEMKECLGDASKMQKMVNDPYLLFREVNAASF